MRLVGKVFATPSAVHRKCRLGGAPMAMNGPTCAKFPGGAGGVAAAYSAARVGPTAPFPSSALSGDSPLKSSFSSGRQFLPKLTAYLQKSVNSESMLTIIK